MHELAPPTNLPSRPKTLSIIGAGKVGRVLARQFHRHGIFTITDVLNRSLASSQAACDFIGAGRAIQDLASMQAVDVIMLAVSDDQIRTVSLALQQHRVLRPDSILFHCSGALCASELDWNKNRNSGLMCDPETEDQDQNHNQRDNPGNPSSQPSQPETGGAASLHPVRSFADPAAVASQFNGTICSLEGDPAAIHCLHTALRGIGAEVIVLDSAGKTLYHAAAVIANNYAVTLLDAALTTYQEAGIPLQLAQRMAAPLMRDAIDNVMRLGAGSALTGPIARKDQRTVARHQTALNTTNPVTAELYRALAVATQLLATRPTEPQKPVTGDQGGR